MVGKVLGKCRVLKRLGRGGMGDVYLAEHQLLQRKVAIKILPADFVRNEELLARFRREAVSVARLQHPSIAQVHDVGDEEGCQYIVMQYVEGRNLQETLDDQKKIEPKEAARIALEVARGLQVAHGSGIIHRDIKPANILVSHKGEVKIVDFGLALDADSKSLTLQGTIMGTPHFLSPEQAEGKPTDSRSDLYSVGICLYTMVTGVRPFTGESHMAILYKQIHEKAKDPRNIDPAIPDPLAEIILRCIEKKPDRRYQSAEELAGDLERFGRGVTVRKTHAARHGPSPTGRFPSVRTKRPSPAGPLAIAIGLSVVCLILLVVTLTGKKKEPAPTPVTVKPPETAKRNPPPAIPLPVTPLPTPPPVRPTPPVTPPVVLPPATPSRKPIEGFEFVAPSDLAHCLHLEGHVLPSGPDGNLVAYPKEAEASTIDDHSVYSRRSDLADFHVAFEIHVKSGQPKLAARYRATGDPAELGRRHPPLVLMSAFPRDRWLSILYKVEGDKAELTVDGKPEPLPAVPPNAPRVGRFALRVSRGDAFEFRNLQLKVLRTIDPKTLETSRDPSASVEPTFSLGRLTETGRTRMASREYSTVDQVFLSLQKSTTDPATKEALAAFDKQIVASSKVVEEFRRLLAADRPATIKLRDGKTEPYYRASPPYLDAIHVDEILARTKTAAQITASDLVYFLLSDGEALLALDHLVEKREIRPECREALDFLVDTALAQKKDAKAVAEKLFLMRDKLGVKNALKVEQQLEKLQ
jgi:serine/threonine protein kinase